MERTVVFLVIVYSKGLSSGHFDYNQMAAGCQTIHILSMNNMFVTLVFLSSITQISPCPLLLSSV